MVNRIILNETAYFGPGAIQKIVEEVRGRGLQKVMVVTDKDLIKFKVATRITDLLAAAGIAYETYDKIKANPTIRNVQEGVAFCKECGADVLVAVGGGSAIDTSKAIAIIRTNPEFADVRSLEGASPTKHKAMPIIAVSTTSGTAAEVTINYVITDEEKHRKFVCADPHDIPLIAIVDSEMCASMPPRLCASTGMDALVHAIESYLSLNASPITDALAIGAIKLIAKALPKAYANPANLQARDDMATASLMAGMAFGNAGVGAVHALAYPLGGRFNIAHGVSNALLLPYVMHWNKLACVERMQDIAQAMGVNVSGLSVNDAADQAVEAMTRLCAAVEIPSGLRSFGVPEDAIPAMATEAAGIERLMRNNPRKLSAADIEKIYRAAY